MERSDKVKLEVKDLHLVFGGIKALDQVSFEVKEGEIFAIIGPNGAGKTCILNCINGFYKPEKGKGEIKRGANATELRVVMLDAY